MIRCLHGFLGSGHDFAPFVDALERTGFGGVDAPDLFAAPREPSSLADAGAALARDAVGDVVIGYSLGGRLALHALLAAPRAWRAAVIVAAHPGLADPEARATRRRDDEAWARRFESAPWPALIDAWNERAVFGARRPPTRDEHRFDRGALASGLRAWSLGAQAPLLDRLATIPCPVLWIVGGDDYPFRTLGEQAVTRLPRGEFVTIPGAAHRVLVDAPDRFADETTEFLRRVRGD